MNKETKRQTIEKQLNTLIALHDRAIRVGWCALSYIHDTTGAPRRADDSIIVTGEIDNRGRYGLVPGMVIRSRDGTPLAAMTIELAYYYANLGGSIINTRDYFSRLGCD
jgi:hypothetical protein